MAKRLWVWLKRVTIGWVALMVAGLIVTSATCDLMIHHGRYRGVIKRAREPTIKAQATVFFRGDWNPSISG